MLRNSVAALRSVSLIVLSATALLGSVLPATSAAQDKGAKPAAQQAGPAAAPASDGPAGASAPAVSGASAASAASAAAPGGPMAAGAGPVSARQGKETVENPYGLEALWKGSDFVAKTVLVLLLVMSMGSWYIIVTKFVEQGRIKRQAQGVDNGFWNAQTIRQGADTLEDGSPFRFIAEAGLEATRKHEGLLGQINLNDWMSMSIQRSIDRVQSRMQDGLAFLATVGSISPFVGLFGTVWGILNALTAIGVAGQASIDKVAGPVGEALIMTAIGLAVAVPAVMGYNWLVRRNKAVMDDVRSFGGDLHAVLLAAGNTGAGATAAKG
ncbi:MAG: MotA/TolQ/ExbB proton channel family protein [Novosphingobium sp.]|nr:MotA/TolQ/ExbB proton channel family protein [Novosphingobium sp.]